MQFIYRAKVEPDEAGYIVAFPDVPEAITHGATLDEALDNAADALEVAFLGRMKDGEDLPSPRARGAALFPVPLSAQLAAKSAFYSASRKERLSKSALAKRLGKDEKEIRRMLDP